MGKLNKNKISLIFGVSLGSFHLVWALIVLSGFAQVLMDFVLTIHMIKPFMVVNEFSISLAATLIVFTSLVGYIAGYCFALIWNSFHK